MSDSAVIWFILGPVLGLAIVIGWLTRNDPFSVGAVNKYKEELMKSKLFRVFQAEEIVGSFGIPIAVYYLSGALIGSLLLIGLGMVFSIRTNLLRGSLLSKGMNKTTGILYVLVGAIGFIFWAGSKV